MREDRSKVWLHTPVYWRSSQGRGQLWLRPGEEAVCHHGEGRVSAPGEFAVGMDASLWIGPGPKKNYWKSTSLLFLFKALLTRL